VAAVVALCFVAVHRGVGEVVFPRRVVFTGRLFHNSTIVRRHLSQPQLARSEYATLYTDKIVVKVRTNKQ